MSEWKEITLGEICKNVMTGGTPLSSNEDFYRSGNIPWLKTKEVNFCWITQTEHYISESGLLNSSAKIIPINSVIIAMYGQGDTAGRVAINKIPLATNQACCNLIIDETIADYQFIYFYLKNSYSELVSKKTGSAQPNLNTKIIKDFEIVLPILAEQKRIADVLSCLDAKIENLRRQNETLEQIAQTLFKHWFIDFEFPFDFAQGKPNADGKPYKSSGGAMFTSAIGDIPEGWKIGKLGNEFEILMGQSPSGSSFNEDKQGMIFFQGRTDFGFRFPTIRLYTTEPSRIAEKFDVLVSVRAPVGDVNLASDKCCIGRGLAAVKSQYKSYCLHKIKSFKKLFNLFESEGTVFGSINKQSFNNLESIIPTDKVIKDFEALVTTIDQKFYVNDLQIQTLTKTRDSLLPKLMSGQLRVKS